MKPKDFFSRLLHMRAWLLALLLAAPLWAYAGTFDLDASVDHNDLELGETLQFTLRLTVHGSLAFQPNIATPDFTGFQAQGPSQSYSSTWINGQATIVYNLTWELEAVKAGRFVLGPYRATAKDAAQGDIERLTQPIVVTVRHPKGLTLPSQASQPSADAQDQEPAPDVNSLHDIKPDRALPWSLVGLALAALLGLLGLLVWLARPRAEREPEEAMPADPAQAAILKLDRALQLYLIQNDGRAYATAVGETLKQYLRQRLGLRPGLTLGEAFRDLRRRYPQVLPRRAQALRQRLDLFVYGGAAFPAEEREALDLDARDLIRGFESAAQPSAVLEEFSKALGHLAGVWREGQAKSAWMGMRAAALERFKAACGSPARRALPKGTLAAALRTLEAPELLRTLDWLDTEVPPRGADPEETVERLMRLAAAVESFDKAVLKQAAASETQADKDTDTDTKSQGDE
jgi:hypothetical protein